MLGGLTLLSVDQGLWGLSLADEVCILPFPSFPSFPLQVPRQPLFPLFSLQPVQGKLLEKVTWMVTPEDGVQVEWNRFVFPLFPFISS